jgi:hypothetical protein
MHKTATAMWNTLIYGFFGMLPGILFAAIPAYFISLLDAERVIGMHAVLLYGGSCGGYWLAKKMLMQEIKKMPANASKSDVLEALK